MTVTTCKKQTADLVRQDFVLKMGAGYTALSKSHNLNLQIVIDVLIKRLQYNHR